MINSHLTPLLFGLAFFSVTAARSVWSLMSAGINPYVIDHRDPMYRFIANVFFAIFAGLVLYFAVIAYWPAFEGAMGRLDWASGNVSRWISVASMTVATVWTGIAQFSMGNSWRIGIPQGEAPGLRTRGLFAVSRNPIFLGMLMFVLGMTLWSPSAITVASFVATYIALEVQIRAEEAFLEREHGENYRQYQARVRRWI